MYHKAVQIINDEHAAITAVLYTLRYLVHHMRDGSQQPNFPLLRAIFDYISAYPDRWHHPKEEQYLFVAVKRRTHDVDALIEGLEREHQKSYPMLRELQNALLAFQNASPGAGGKFYDLCERYVEIEWAHMRKEEDELIPEAEKVLTEADWTEIDSAFQENDNPLFGIKPKQDAERLYQKILSLAPDPMGYSGKGETSG